MIVVFKIMLYKKIIVNADFKKNVDKIKIIKMKKQKTDRPMKTYLYQFSGNTVLWCLNK